MTNQKLLLLVIISFILMTLMCDSGGILWREIWCFSLSEFKGLKFVSKMLFCSPSWLKSMHLGFDAVQVYNWIIFLTYILIIQLCRHMYMVWWYSNCLQFFKWKLWCNFVSLSAYAFELTIEILFFIALLGCKKESLQCHCCPPRAVCEYFGDFFSHCKTKTDRL